MHKKYRNLSKSKKPFESQETVEKTFVDSKGEEIKVQ